MTHIQYASIINVAASSHFESTDKREYFDGIGTSPTPDSYGRIISADSMPQIAIDFANKLRVLDSHKHNTNGIGQTVRGEVINIVQDGVNVPQVHFSGYILKGLGLDGQTYQTTDDWAEVVKDGMANTFSMGFFSERDICNICQKPIFSYSCRHYPLEWTEITDTETGEEKRVQCTYTCFECRAVEVSFVYSPANPDARLIQKAKALAEKNLFLPEQIQRIENRLKVAILETDRSYFDMALNEQDKQDVAAIVSEALKPIAAEVATLKEQKPTSPPAAAPTIAGPPVIGDPIVNITDAQGNVIGTMKASEIPQPPTPLTKEAVTEAVQTAIAPIGERLEKVETAMKSGDSIDDRETAATEYKKQFKRVFGKDPDKTQTAALEALPDVASINLLSEALKQTANEKFHAGRKTAGLGDELENGEENGEDGKPSLKEVRANPM